MDKTVDSKGSPLSEGPRPTATKASKVGVAQSKLDLGGLVDADLDTFVTALYVTIDDAIRMRPELRQGRPRVGLAP